MKIKIILLFIISSFAIKAQTEKKLTLKNGHQIQIVADTSGVTFSVSNQQGNTNRFIYPMIVDSTFFRRKPFVVKQNENLENVDVISIGDSTVLLALPDWNDRFYVWKLVLKNELFGPENKEISPVAIVKTDYVFVNLDYNYLVAIYPEQVEYFYGKTSRWYHIVEIYGLTNELPKNSLKYYDTNIPLNPIYEAESFKSFTKTMRKVLKTCDIPW